MDRSVKETLFLRGILKLLFFFSVLYLEIVDFSNQFWPHIYQPSIYIFSFFSAFQPDSFLKFISYF